MIHPAGPMLPVIPLVVRLRAQRQMRGVYAEPVVAAMSDHLILSHDGPLQHTVDETVGVGLTSVRLGAAGEAVFVNCFVSSEEALEVCLRVEVGAVDTCSV